MTECWGLHSCGWATSSSGLALAHLMLLLYSPFTPFCSFDKIGSEVFQSDWDHSCLAGWWILVSTSHCCNNLDHTGGRTRASHSACLLLPCDPGGFVSAVTKGRLLHVVLICQLWAYAILEVKTMQGLVMYVIKGFHRVWICVDYMDMLETLVT